MSDRALHLVAEVAANLPHPDFWRRVDCACEIAADGLLWLAGWLDPDRPVVISTPLEAGYSVLLRGKRIATIKMGRAGVSLGRRSV